MIDLRWFAVLCALAFAGCLQASVQPPVDEADVPRTPHVAFQHDDRFDEVIAIAVETGFEWDTLGLKADVAGTQVTAGSTDDEWALELVPSEFRHPSTSTEDVVAGDFLRFCAVDGTSGPVTYTITDLETNTIVHVVTFEGVAACH